MSETPRIRVTIAAPVSEVWSALRDKDRIRHWHGWEFDGGPDGSLDQEIDLIYFTDVTVGEHRIDLNGGDTIDLEQVEGGTRVTLTRAAPEDDPDWARYYDEITEGWITFIHQLQFAVERHPRAARRTVLLRGKAPSALAAISDDPRLLAGAPYEGSLAGGIAGGRVWFRSDHQLGLTVSEWNDALLVLHRDGASDEVMALLSLYGVDEDRFSELRDRWGAWWHSSDAETVDERAQSSKEP
ncbi:SRPBCC domain-containing protein [Microbacterium sp. LTA6]|uniref:SRPBCC family protein n=1 Tax=Microbacterium sp. LTA6 TaxID=3129771 RepID=UPI00324F5372